MDTDVKCRLLNNLYKYSVLWCRVAGEMPPVWWQGVFGIYFCSSF